MRWEDIYLPLHQVGAVRNQRDLSALAGGSPSLMSSSKARGREPSISSMAGLFAYLDELEGEACSLLMTGQSLTEEERQTAIVAHQLKQEVLQAIKRKALGPRKGGAA